MEIRYLGENPPLRQLEAGKWTRGFATLGLIVPAAALAQDGPICHVGVGVGSVSNDDFVDANDDGSLSNINSDTSDTGWQVMFGYRFNPNFALEGSYTDLGETGFTAVSESGDSWAEGAVGTRFESDGWMVSALGFLPVSERWTLFARLGILGWETTETFTEPSGTSVDRNSGTDAVYGVGAEYDPGNRNDIVLRAEVGKTKVDDDGDSVTAVTAAVLYEF
ncbi:MAG: outer membrane beta-barrel protein [Acidobacteriota bacterium]|nr:outer membrane beta-barrel protein [Acidobacteriota bacterium]